MNNCKKTTKKSQPKESKIEKPRPFYKIKQSGKLSVIMDYNSTCYFIYRGKPMGFHYEILKAFADNLGLSLEVNINTEISESFDKLNKHDCDLLTYDLTITSDRKEKINFSNSIFETRQVLVQRKPGNWRKLPSSILEDSLIRNQLELEGKSIYVQKNTSFVERLQNLEQEASIDINIVQPDELTVEQLIARVSAGEIDYTVADEHVALMNQTYYDNIDIKTAISFPQRIAWGVAKDADTLMAELNAWLETYKKTAEFKYLYNKYFLNPKHVDIVESELYSVKTGRISPYDEWFKFYANLLDWDWRLIASLSYQESRFHPEVVSWAGASGLMQLMPETAHRFGADSNASIEQQIKAGVLFLKYLDEYFMSIIPDKNERIRFILASYNSGPGHVMDARRLADKYGKDSNVWKDNVDTFILLKSVPKYYHDPVVKYGYSRGEESFNFVREILERYEMYKNVIH